jgi:uncharacterized membrane protein YeaQ/YmgE (transglycosylase-associated protein family)
MEISGIVSALIVGLLIGVLGRIALPGRQHIPVWLTIVIGIIAALVGAALANAFGVADTKGIDWIEWLIQIGLAMVGVSFADRAYGRGR